MGGSGERYVSHFFPGTGNSYDRVVAWTTLGLDARWKRRMLDLVPPSRVVLDLACGTGIVTFALLDRFPAARVVGVDVTEDYLAVARAKHQARGGDVVWLLGDAVATPVADWGPFDAIVSSYLPKYVNPDRLLDNVLPALRPGGVVVLHDFTRPAAALPRLLWRAWYAVLEGVAPRRHPEWRNVFDGSLRRLVAGTRWVGTFRVALQLRGYEEVRVCRLTFGAAAIVAARKPLAPPSDRGGTAARSSVPVGPEAPGGGSISLEAN
jgi:demethylmenaquinone methyltransferase/2-methoxy-6-polyprenyl-1,4-benzoquinol methylase